MLSGPQWYSQENQSVHGTPFRWQCALDAGVVDAPAQHKYTKQANYMNEIRNQSKCCLVMLSIQRVPRTTISQVYMGHLVTA